MYINIRNKFVYNIIIIQCYTLKIRDKGKGEKFMDDRLMVLRRANLRMLGHLLMDTSFPFEEGLGEEESEKEAQAGVEDDLRLALRHEGEGQEQRIREVVKTAWKKSKALGFMEGMQAGARIVLALVGEEEIRI